MINEQIKKIIDDEVNKIISNKLEIFSLPLISEYRILTWTGTADGATNLLPRFDINSIIGRYMIIKSLQIIPYYNVDSQDILFSDGTSETILAGTRINRVFDSFSDAISGLNHIFRLSINGVPSNIFQMNDESATIPPDFKIDNVYYKYPEKIETVTILYGTSVVDVISPLAEARPDVKLYIECYLI